MSTLHLLQNYLEDATKESDISEDAYIKISDYLKKLNNEMMLLSNQIKLLDNEARLDLIELLMKETKEAMDASNFECTYHDLAYEQFNKLRYPFE